MKILLDFDGVMITTPVWRPVPQLSDGFMAFDNTCVQNLAEILQITQADIVLTTTHRIHYENSTWREILENRGLITKHVSKVNNAKKHEDLNVRSEEVLQWVKHNPNENFVIIDDDKSLHNLPKKLKERWVETSFYTGLNEEAKHKALEILLAS